MALENQGHFYVVIRKYYSSVFFFSFKPTLLTVSYIIGVAINNDEYVPTTTPIINENINPLSGTAKMKIATSTNNVVKEVFNVRLNVLFNALLTCLAKGQVACS